LKYGIKERAVDVKVVSNSKRPVSALVLIPVLFLLASGCAGAIQAASGSAASADKDTFATDNSLAPGVQLAMQESALLHFAPAPAQVAVGGVAAVQLRLENVQNLYGIEVHLTFDASVVQVEDDDPGRDGVQVAVGELPYPEFIVQNLADNGSGRLDYAVVQLAPRPPSSGSGAVATIHFRGVSEGTSPIRFISAKLASPDGLEIPVTLQEGSIVVAGAGIPTETPPPTSTPEGPTPTPGPATPTPYPTVVPAPLPVPSSVPAPIVAPPPMAGCANLYVVRTGDTAFSIARRFGVPLDALAAANGLSSSYYIQIGQLLTIPGRPGPTGTAHTVQPGETLYAIARRYGTSVETLAALNRIPHPWHVKLGQTLLICP
jgi:LysM repeat protein